MCLPNVQHGVVDCVCLRRFAAVQACDGPFDGRSIGITPIQPFRDRLLIDLLRNDEFYR